VEIHIADAAEFIKKNSPLDSQLKSRDQSVYIKNYYQPMVYDSLRNLLSLKEDCDKLAYTLSFKINSQGFVDFKAVDFFKSIVNIENNLSHQKLLKGT